MKAHIVKQAEVFEVQVGENIFYLRPFPAFKAVFVSGELTAALGPILGSLTSLVPLIDTDAPLETNIGAAAKPLMDALASLSGDKVERLMKNLLIHYKNITVDVDGCDAPQTLTESLSDQLFSCYTEEMFILAFYVIKFNFAGFFGKIESQFGQAFEKLKAKMTSENMEPSTEAASQI